MPEDIYWKKYTERFRTYPVLIREAINPDIKLIVCIPVCAEPDLIQTLSSLARSSQTNISVEVILLFNTNAWMTQEEWVQHGQSWNECLIWIAENDQACMRFIPVLVNEVPDMKGGVGWARKLAMDEAARRLDENGTIICLDADCKVAPDYIGTIYNQFTMHSKFDAASIYFEHDYEGLSGINRDAIICYELHLRYLVHAQRWCGHPFAFQTVGSSMAVRRNAYLAQGGMNTKRAGEDFYFLQKFIETDKLFEIKNTTVFPSSRISNRVPFGTGKAMEQAMLKNNVWKTTDFEIFRLIQPLFTSLEKLQNSLFEKSDDEHILQNIPRLRNEVIQYLLQINLVGASRDIAAHTNSFVSFSKRFFRYFNAFRMIKYMHYMRDTYFPDIEVANAVFQLLTERGYHDHSQLNTEEYLKVMRQIDKE